MEKLGFCGKTEIRELLDGRKLLKVFFPKVDRQKVLKFLREMDLGMVISPMPIIESAQDSQSALSLMVGSEGEAIRLAKDLKAAGMDTEVEMAGGRVKLLHINGVVGQVGQALDRTLVKKVGADKDEGIKKEITHGEGVMAEQFITSDVFAKMPHLGPCSYLVIDQRQLELWDEGMAAKILKLLDTYSKNDNYYFNFDTAGNLVTAAFQERSIGGIVQLAHSLGKINGEKTHMLIGKGRISQNSMDSLVMDGYLPREDLEKWREIGERRRGMYCTQGDIRRIVGSRDATSVQIRPVETKEGVFYKILTKRKNSLKAGRGPDQMIGFEKEMERMSELLAVGNPTKLILLEGEAGAGKSRLCEEVTKNIPNRMVITMDPAGRNIPGFSLANFADQIANFLQVNGALMVERPALVALLNEYLAKDENEKLHEVSTFGGVTESFCTIALHFLSDKLPDMIMVFDDVHHIDRYSERRVIQIIDDFINNSPNPTKLVISKRPEARYASPVQEEFLEQTKLKAKICLFEDDPNKPGETRLLLNFSNRDTARRYVFHSLPDDRRMNLSANTEKTLGDWAEKLGEKARTPFEMTSFLNYLKADMEENFIFQGDFIGLSRSGYEKLENYCLQDDLLVYHLGKIHELLNTSTQEGMEKLEVLQMIALLGTKVASAKQLTKLLNVTCGMEEAKARNILDELNGMGFLKSSEHDTEVDDTVIKISYYAIWHENLRDMLLNSTMMEEKRSAMAYRLSENLGQFSWDISQFQQFSIRHYAASGRVATDQKFWEEYTKFAGEVLDLTDERKQYALGYEISSAILDNLKGLEVTNKQGRASREGALSKALLNLINGEEIDANLQGILERALFSMADNAYYLGKFDRVYEVARLAEQIYKDAEKASERQKFLKIGFNAAVAEVNTAKLKYFYGKLDLGALTPDEKTLFEMKFKYRSGDNSAARKMAAEARESQKIPAEILRMCLRIEMEEILDQIADSGVDYDVQLCGLDLTPSQEGKLKTISKEVKNFREAVYGMEGRTGKGSTDRLKLSPIDELQLLDLEGQCAALLRDYEQAKKMFSEYYRLSRMLDIAPEALRAAKQKGDVEVIQALAVLDKVKQRQLGDDIVYFRRLAEIDVKLQQNIVYRRLLREAIETYTEDGLKLALLTRNKEYLKLLSAQRLRALCIFLGSHKRDEGAVDENGQTFIYDELKKSHTELR